MDILIKRCTECPMLGETYGCLVCNHPGGPGGVDGEIDPLCPLLREDTILSCKSDNTSKVIFEDWKNTSDFLARQITDDLCCAGLDARFAQHIIEKTLLNWPDTGRTWGKE